MNNELCTLQSAWTQLLSSAFSHKETDGFLYPDCPTHFEKAAVHQSATLLSRYRSRLTSLGHALYYGYNTVNPSQLDASTAIPLSKDKQMQLFAEDAIAYATHLGFLAETMPSKNQRWPCPVWNLRSGTHVNDVGYRVEALLSLTSALIAHLQCGSASLICKLVTGILQHQQAWDIETPGARDSLPAWVPSPLRASCSLWKTVLELARLTEHANIDAVNIAQYPLSHIRHGNKLAASVFDFAKVAQNDKSGLGSRALVSGFFAVSAAARFVWQCRLALHLCAVDLNEEAPVRAYFRIADAYARARCLAREKENAFGSATPALPGIKELLSLVVELNAHMRDACAASKQHLIDNGLGHSEIQKLRPAFAGSQNSETCDKLLLSQFRNHLLYWKWNPKRRTSTLKGCD